MKPEVSEGIVEKWLRAWSLSRDLPMPQRYASGYRVNVGEPKQKVRYVFPELNNDFFSLARTVDESWIFLKVCAPYEEFRQLIPTHWIVQPQGYMMYCNSRMNFGNNAMPDGYSIDIQRLSPEKCTVRIIYENKEAAIGRLIIIDGIAFYDRIVTEEKHRRKGLAKKIMAVLEDIALSEGIQHNFLVATEQGRLLYESLGWTLYSVYTSVVIPSDH
ncbi:GNAT family N-acetyltransferase [uncultured Chryseobacterium sp.]|uniref:GNAT family N-acetyltransferase n=1 Tax=uncultured Chryseobacterium sp. TaxID=259322 RepID=UPI0025DD27BA|nr:GNAT family N-acetyltransferase [uncultured Chryseobacterium sp.]